MRGWRLRTSSRGVSESDTQATGRKHRRRWQRICNGCGSPGHVSSGWPVVRMRRFYLTLKPAWRCWRRSWSNPVNSRLPLIDKQQARRAFSRAAEHYDVLRKRVESAEAFGYHRLD